MEDKIREGIIFLCRDSLRNILSSVYGNKENVDEDLIDVGFLSSQLTSLLPLSNVILILFELINIDNIRTSQ